jgi:hypothetical protein
MVRQQATLAALGALAAVVGTTSAFGLVPSSRAAHGLVRRSSGSALRMSTVERAPVHTDVDEADPVKVADIREFSYSEQYDSLLKGGATIDPKKAVPKPSEAAQVTQPGAKKVPFSRVYGVLKRPRFFNRAWGPQVSTLSVR